MINVKQLMVGGMHTVNKALAVEQLAQLLHNGDRRRALGGLCRPASLDQLLHGQRHVIAQVGPATNMDMGTYVRCFL